MDLSRNCTRVFKTRSALTALTLLALLLPATFSFVYAQTPPTRSENAEAIEQPEPTIPTDPTEQTPEEKPPTAREICAEDSNGEPMIDRIRSGLYRIVCASASWFDGLFGDARFDEKYRSTYGSVTIGTVWSERKSFQEVLRFRAKFYLPQMNQSLHAFVGRVDREDYLTESKQDVFGLPQQINPDTTDQTLVGVGYTEPLKKHGSFDISTGIRITFPLDPYVKASYGYAHPLGERNLIRFREVAFWQNSEEFGVTSRVDLDRAVGERNLMRFTASGTFSQVSEGARWFSNLTLFHFISDARALAYEAAANGSTDRAVPLTDYALSLIYRQRVLRDWLLIEARGGVDWPRDWPFERRRFNLNAGLAVELRFGRKAETDGNELSTPIKN